MSFTREYERMRPLDEDRHDRAATFTVRRERPFDIQLWFINRFLDRKKSISLPRKYIARYYDYAPYRRPEPLLKPIPEPVKTPYFDFPDQMLMAPVVFSGRCLCFCGAKAEYKVRDQLVCINHFQYENEEYSFTHPEVRYYNNHEYMYFEYFRNIWNECQSHSHVSTTPLVPKVDNIGTLF